MARPKPQCWLICYDTIDKVYNTKRHKSMLCTLECNAMHNMIQCEQIVNKRVFISNLYKDIV